MIFTLLQQSIDLMHQTQLIQSVEIETCKMEEEFIIQLVQQSLDFEKGTDFVELVDIIIVD